MTTTMQQPALNDIVHMDGYELVPSSLNPEAYFVRHPGSAGEVGWISVRDYVMEVRSGGWRNAWSVQGKSQLQPTERHTQLRLAVSMISNRRKLAAVGTEAVQQLDKAQTEPVREVVFRKQITKTGGVSLAEIVEVIASKVPAAFRESVMIRAESTKYYDDDDDEVAVMLTYDRPKTPVEVTRAAGEIINHAGKLKSQRREQYHMLKSEFDAD